MKKFTLTFLFSCLAFCFALAQETATIDGVKYYLKNGGSRNLVGIAIQLSDSEEEEFFVGYSMLISPEKFDFGVE